jgi:hypothetical protein
VVVQRVLEEPEDDPEHCVADRRLAEGSAVAGELRQFFPGRVVAVEQRGQRPGRDVLDEARQQAAEDRRPRQGRLEPRVCRAQKRAVLHVEREADGLPVVAARHELAQDLDVVVLGVEKAFVERLLERHHYRRDRARDPPSQARLQHRSSMSGFWARPTDADKRLGRRSAT